MAGICGRVFMTWLALALLMAVLGGAKALPLCNIDTKQLEMCKTAVTGPSPPLPTQQCCEVVRSADLPCLCGYKNALSALKIDPKNALSLPAKCGLQTPPECQGN